MGEEQQHQPVRPFESEPVMSRTPFISVVMPCYNVERYVAAALESVASQDLDDWEIVAVDDCSTDATLSVLRDAASRDGRIRVFALDENRGVSAARNFGLTCAQGTHVAFLDPDDAYAPGLFAWLDRVVKERDPHMIAWGVREVYSNEAGAVVLEKDVVMPCRSCCTPQEVHAAILELERLTLFGYAWNKLYRRDLLDEADAKFPCTSINEDVFFNMAVAGSLRSLEVVGEALYRYARRDVQRRTSLTARFLPDYFDLSARRVEGMLGLYRAWGEETQEVKGVLGTIYARYVLSALQRNCDPRAGMDRNKRRDWLEALYERPLSRDLLEHADPDGSLARVCARLLKRRSRTAVLLAARAVYAVNVFAPGLFSRLKQSR